MNERVWNAREMPDEPEERTRLRVALDGTPLLGKRTGIGVATSLMLIALAARDDVTVSAFAVTWKNRRDLALSVPDGVGTEQRPMVARPLMAAWSRMNRPKIERFVGPIDVVHGTNYVVPPSRRAGRVVSVYDLTFARHPELCEPATLRFDRLIARALRGGAIVHTPSHFIAEEVREHFGARREQMATVHLGVPPLAAPDHHGAAQVVPAGRPYILSIGTAEPRKDLPSLVRAFDALAARHADLELVLVGPPGWGTPALEEAIRASHARDRIRQAGFVSDEVLSGLLSGARALAYPSIYEGFGFPPLQAMAAGVPVVTTRAGAVTEIVGGAALVVDPGEVDDLAAALQVAVDDEAQRSVLITAGRARTKDFTWEKTASGLMEAYRRSRER